MKLIKGGHQTAVSLTDLASNTQYSDQVKSESAVN